jgi:transcriptional regulator with XRE-family HTH domain
MPSSLFLANSGLTTPMVVGERIKAIRESKKLSRGDVERLAGLLRCYTSRVENSHTVPNVETLEKYGRALEIPLHRLFYDGGEPPQKPKLSLADSADTMWGAKGKNGMNARQRKLLLAVALWMAGRNRR